MEVMYDRRAGRRYEVYSIDVDHGLALYYDSHQASRQNGAGGWGKVQIGKLIPEAYYNKVSGSYMSKTERNDVKQHLKLVDAIWECTDGIRYPHAEIDEAIEHQRQLLNSINDLEV